MDTATPANQFFLSLAYDLTKVTWLYEQSSPFATYQVSQLGSSVNMHKHSIVWAKSEIEIGLG